MSLIVSELIGGEQPFDDPAEQKSLLDKVIGAVKEVLTPRLDPCHFSTELIEAATLCTKSGTRAATLAFQVERKSLFDRSTTVSLSELIGGGQPETSPCDMIEVQVDTKDGNKTLFDRID